MTIYALLLTLVADPASTPPSCAQQHAQCSVEAARSFNTALGQCAGYRPCVDAALRVLNRDLKACGQALDECLKPPAKA
jgi:hypothetical protein